MFIEFLDRLTRSYPGPQGVLICDNHSTHHAKLVKQWVQKRPGRIELHFLASYSPELNPDEYLNPSTKTSNGTCAWRIPGRSTSPGLKSEIRRFLSSRQRQPHIVTTSTLPRSDTPAPQPRCHNR
ncbi:MAG: transposase [Solirubrobacteraceae bacterium]